MCLLLLTICLTAAVQGRPEKEDGDPHLWQQLKTVLPAEYSRYAEQTGVAKTRIFQNNVVRKLHDQVVSDTQAIEARQKILEEYIKCSCPECPEETGNKEHSGHHVGSGRQLGSSLGLNIPSPLQVISHPQEALANLLRSCETEQVVDTVKLLRVSLLEVQRRSQQNAALVTCNCVHAKRCKRILDPLVFSIVTGHNDTALERAYWQSELEGFPQVMERGIVDTLQNAAASILTYFFQSFRPQHEQQESPAQHHTATPYAGIFAPGANPQEWTETRTKPQECPHVQVNITNSKKGTDIDVKNSTSTETLPEEPHISKN